MQSLTKLKYQLHKKKMVWIGRKIKPCVEPMSEPIDFVVTWVDGNDSAWQKEKQKYQTQMGVCNKADENGALEICMDLEPWSVVLFTQI